MNYNTPSTSEGLNVINLVSQLSSPKLSERHHARHDLVHMGSCMVPVLMKTVKVSYSTAARQEAIKALGEIKDPDAIPVLIDALMDEHFEVRWDAAESLIAYGSRGLPALLIELQKHYDSLRLRQGAHHILRAVRGVDNADDPLEQLYRALNRLGSQSEIPWLAHNAYETLFSHS